MRPHWARCIFLKGEMGAGKTTFVRGLAKGMGIIEPISSPTYALVAEYPLRENEKLRHFYHIDLYRSEAASALSAPQIREILEDQSALVAIEWSERLLQEMLPAARIEIKIIATEEENRTFEIEFCDTGVTREEDIKNLYEEFAVPAHVQKHIFAVTKVADHFAAQLAKNNVPLNAELVHTGAMLHDFVRVCNFKNFDARCFFEILTPHKLGIWKKLAANFNDKHHADVGADILEKKGFIATADLVRNHNTASALKQLTLEEKCVLLADRHVLHDTVVSLDERMQDGKTRHRHDKDVQYQTIRKKIYAIDAEIKQLGGVGRLDLDLKE